MSFDPMRLKTLGAAIAGTLALGACDDPVADTDLRPEGDPEVLAVLVFNDTVNGAVESATYCKPNDPKRPGKVGIPAYGINPIICPTDGSAVQPLTDAYPDAWYIRIVFDELLDPDVETLEPILDAAGNATPNFTGSLARTQPVTLRCQDVSGAFADVDYDGYYSPAGNAVTWPLGPSLVIQPLDPTIVPVGSECTVTIKESVKDKDDHAVPAGDRGPYSFKLAPISVIGTSTHDGDVVDPRRTSAITGTAVRGVDVAFNVELAPTPTTFCADPANPACFRILPGDKATNPVAVYGVFNGTLALRVDANILGNEEYTFEMPASLMVKDKCGRDSAVGGLEPPIGFATNVARFTTFNPGGGNAVAPAKNIVLSFNTLVNAATFEENVDWVMDPKPAGFAVTTAVSTASITFSGNFNLNTKYKLTIQPGAVLKDAYGVQDITFPADPAARVAEYTTTGAIAITAQTPASGARIAKDPTATQAVVLTFNQKMASASLDPSEFTFTKADGTPLAVAAVVAASAGANITINAPMLPAGSYKFVLKKDAVLMDTVGNSYTQAANREISFTITDVGPDGPDFKCLGQP